jgi:hypothetical protein
MSAFYPGRVASLRPATHSKCFGLRPAERVSDVYPTHRALYQRKKSLHDYHRDQAEKVLGPIKQMFDGFAIPYHAGSRGLKAVLSEGNAARRLVRPGGLLTFGTRARYAEGRQARGISGARPDASLAAAPWSIGHFRASGPASAFALMMLRSS